MNEEIWKRLVKFVGDEISSSTALKISRNTKLVEDLGLIGDDADDFMGKFSQLFSVGGGDFRFDDYFPPEGFDLVGLIGGIFTEKRENPKFAPLTLGMLEHAAKLGVWDTGKINSDSTV